MLNVVERKANVFLSLAKIDRDELFFYNSSRKHGMTFFKQRIQNVDL